MIIASLVILWLAAAYLASLGLAVIVQPDLARRFLSGFAQSTRANLAETVLRMLVGLAFLGASSQSKDATVAIVIGLFLMVTALLMPLLPDFHRRIATQSTTRLFKFFPLFGLSSLAMAALLLWFTL